MRLLGLKSSRQYNDAILLPAALENEKAQRLNQAITLYNLAGAHSSVVSCIGRGLGDHISEPGGGGDEAKKLEKNARDILRHYDRTNQITGRERDIVIRLLGVREAMEAKEKGRLEAALEVLQFSCLLSDQLIGV